MKLKQFVNDKGIFTLIIFLIIGSRSANAQELLVGFANQHTYLEYESFWHNHYEMSYRKYWNKWFSWNVTISSSQRTEELIEPKSRFDFGTSPDMGSFNNFDLSVSFNIINSKKHRFSILAGAGLRKRSVFKAEIGRSSTLWNLWNDNEELVWHRFAHSLDETRPTSTIGIDENWNMTAIMAAEYMYYIRNLGVGYTFRLRHFEAASIGPLISYRFSEQNATTKPARVVATLNISNFQINDFGSGIATNVGINYNLSEKFFIYSGLGIYNAANYPDNVQEYESFFQYQAHFFEASLGYKIFQNSNHSLNFQTGPLFRIEGTLKPLNFFYTETDLIFGFDASGEDRYYLEVDIQKSNDFGANAALEYQYRLNNHLSIGAQVRYNYFANNPALQYGLGIGLDL